MDLNHLHLHVADRSRSERFYETHFGFREHARHGDLLFLRNEHGFELALMPDPRPPGLPPWFHFGFRLDTPDVVRRLHASMKGAGVDVTELHEEASYVSFRCKDPDGYGIEVYYE